MNPLFVDIAAAALVLLPLAGAALAMPLGLYVNARAAELAATISVGLAAMLAMFVLAVVASTGYVSTVTLLPWVQTDAFSVDWSVRIDALSAVMFFVVAGVAALIHIYSLGYMHKDPARPRFFCYLSLFTFMMLALVSADNLLQLFFGWEGVGLASYLLIGFWHERPAPNAAALKAFIVNRVGDSFFILGMALLLMSVGSLAFDEIFTAAPRLADMAIALPFGFSLDAANLACFFLLAGAMGKSAQFLLHTWLPDAMEGPTPVSALIHAATMVTAGVFMIARCAPLYEQAPMALIAVAIVGAITSLFAATIGLVQNDIKRVIAYSTCSQLGYMFAALGLGAYAAAIFHLFTHAFFKALLFLGAGSVIHAMDDEQDMRRMAGLSRKKMPVTWLTMLIGTLALTGFPLTAGYFSKDVIIEAAAQSGSLVAVPVFWLLIISAVLTSFYSWRLFFLTFHTEENVRSGRGLISAHESPPIMTLPMIGLAVGALIAGIAAYYGFVGSAHEGFWGAALPEKAGGNILEAFHHAPAYIVILPLVAGLVGFGIAWLFYVVNSDIPEGLTRRGVWIYRFLFNKWYFDEIYHFLFVRPAFALGRIFWQRGDVGLIDGIGPNGVAARVLNLTAFARTFQTGYLYHYAFVMLGGVTLMASWFLWNAFELDAMQIASFGTQLADFAAALWAYLPDLSDLPALPDLPDLPDIDELF